ncbi:hypothetical protein [Pseudactinotalea sp. Z1748]|uniref:hypothetical protein n=1 Tax=Pseudactinotalea sp. Z1748 TaxID=3413027 RepID=UPI003C7B7DE4
MARRSRRRPYRDPHRELDPDMVLRGMTRTETGPDGLRWRVRTLAGGQKDYICPGCKHTIPAGIEHVVAWTEEHLFGAEAGLAERRHWHSGCWRARRFG